MSIVLRPIAPAALLLVAAALRAEEPPIPGGPAIRSIRFEGQEHIPEETLLEKSGLRAGDPWLPSSAEEVVKRLVAWRYLASVGMPRIAAAPDGAVDVILPVKERRITGNITFNGNDALLTETLLAAIGLVKGEPLQDGAVADAEAAILDRYQRDGFLLAQVDGETIDGAGGRVDVAFRIREGRRVYVSDVRLEGAEAIPARHSLSEIETQPRRLFGIISRGYYVPSLVEADVETLRQLYRSQGFLAAEAGFGGIELNEKKTALSVTFLVHEGPRYVLEGARIEGHKLFPTKLLEREAAIQAGGYFSFEAATDGLHRLIRWYEDHADIAPDIGLRLEYGAGATVRVVYEIREEQHYMTGRLRIRGNRWTRDRVVRRNVTLVPGEPFTISEANRTEDKLGESSIFKSVAISTAPGESPRVRDVTVTVDEKEHMGLFQVGGGASRGAGAVAYASLHHDNFDIFRLPSTWNDWRGAFVGGGQIVDVEVIPGGVESDYRLRFVEPYFFRSDLALNVTGATSIYDRHTYDENHLRASAALEKFFDRDHHVSALLGYVADDVRIKNLENDAPPDAFDVKGRTLLAYPRLELRYSDITRSYFSGPKGLTASAKVDFGDRATGSDVDFARAAVSADFYQGFFDRRPDFQHVLHIGVDLSWMAGRNGDDVPLFERTYLGGPRTFAGFEYRRLGPSQLDTPVGGEGAIYGGVDYSFPLFWRELRGFGIFEWGDLEPKFSQLSTERFRTAAGGGLMIRLKLGQQMVPATLYWVKALSSEAGDDEQLFSFTVGLGF